MFMKGYLQKEQEKGSVNHRPEMPLESVYMFHDQKINTDLWPVHD